MRRIYKITAICSLAMILLFGIIARVQVLVSKRTDQVKVGFVCVGDTGSSYTSNFMQVQEELKTLYGDKIEMYTRENVEEGTEEKAFRNLAEQQCDIIFSTSYGYQATVKKLAEEYADIQFCQVAGENANESPVLSNYHTFMGHIYQGRFISGVVAGLKLQELINRSSISKKQAKVGYVAAYPCAEVISGYTAFFLGVRSVVPEAVMTVRYTNSWDNYNQEKIVASELIAENCVIISQHSNTIGPAVACEQSQKMVFHVGYNQDMIEVAPTTSLVSCRINWSPYILSAVKAVFENKKIESVVNGTVNGNDTGGGLTEDWIQMLKVNEVITVPGTEEKVEECIKAFEAGQIHVFKGNYTGINPEDPKDQCDLRTEYIENENGSAPSFHYVLDKVITVK